ncbi:hypothetical protein K502DRAFT_354037 [Neoconidiobolus thromboides FSU 785]|nr:hypothetical protein K502DRAFT_354037 [Neoconidiobolus thromboides FSU 785]
MCQVKNPNRCDQCFKGHRACDRLMPKCSRCIKIFSDCSYVRKAIAKKNLYYIEDKISTFKVKKEGKTTNSSLLFLTHEPQIILLPKNFNLTYTPTYTFTKFPFKYVLQNTMTCLQCINPFVSNYDISTVIPIFDFFEKLKI